MWTGKRMYSSVSTLTEHSPETRVHSPVSSLLVSCHAVKYIPSTLYSIKQQKVGVFDNQLNCPERK